MSLDTARRISDGLFPHQVEGLTFLLGRQRSILADDMGLGKTRQSILALTHACDQGPYLIICPASVKLNWQREIEMVLPEAPTHVVGPTAPPESGYAGWVILNYDILGKHLDALLEHGWAGIVFDEAHYLKNHRSQRSRFSRTLIDRNEGEPYVHALTGTPLTNRPRDLFPLLQLVDHPLGRSFMSFSRRYCEGARNDYGHWVADGASNVEELSVQLHGIMLRRRKDDVLDLPPKMRTWIDVDLPERTRNALNRDVMQFLDPTIEPERTSRGFRTGMGRLASTRKAVGLAKARHTQEFVEGAVEQGEKVLVFSGFPKVLEKLEKHFGDSSVLLTGEVPVPLRQGIVDRFQNDDDVRVYLGQIHAGGTGVNLTAARQVVFNDVDWTPANHWQAEDRAYRIGQTGSVNVTYVVARGTVEEFVRGVFERKARIVDDVVEGCSLGSSMDTDVMEELRGMLQMLDADFARLRADNTSQEEVMRTLREATAHYMQDTGPTLSPQARESMPPISEAAIQALADVLGGPDRATVRVTSSRDPKVRYTVDILGADVTCDCKGFSYRGACTHARTVKEAAVDGRTLPEGYEKVI
ncbi:MAG: DEAD/DEAH box helicase [Candidatus Latescibacterota bacterium]|nr:DEAD/DEAH box helicase [Candidatus Latescibacterota bacterium]